MLSCNGRGHLGLHTRLTCWRYDVGTVWSACTTDDDRTAWTFFGRNVVTIITIDITIVITTTVTITITITTITIAQWWW